MLRKIEDQCAICHATRWVSAAFVFSGNVVWLVKFSIFIEMSWRACKMSCWVDVELEEDDDGIEVVNVSGEGILGS